MKGQSDKTKVVVRHLPPTITQSAFVGEIDGSFSGRINWVSFRPGKSSQKRQSYSRAYIDFKRPEDVVEFAEFFNGHLFVNEKGTQFKAIVEYAPSQRVPKQWSKKDGREGTISKDPEYLEFLEFIAKPVENLPSAEIQLERKEAERAGAPKDAPIITPLMEFVRQKRSNKSVSRRMLSNGKLSRRAGGAGSSNSSSSKRGSEKKRGSTTMYVMRDSTKSSSRKDKSTYVVVGKRDDQQLSDGVVTLASASGTEALGDESGVSGNTDGGKKKILLLKGKEKEILSASVGIPQHNTSASSDKSAISSPSLKQSHRRESSGRIIRSILLNKESRQNQSSGVQSDQQNQGSSFEKDKRPPRPPQMQLVMKDTNGAPDEKLSGNDLHGFSGDKQDKRTRNKDRPDRGVWTPLRRSDGPYASDESLSSASQSTQSGLDSSQGNHGDIKVDTSNSRSGGGGRSSNHSTLENGTHKHYGRRGSSHGVRDADSSNEGKHSKRGGGSGYGSHEKQVWVQKSSSGS